MKAWAIKKWGKESEAMLMELPVPVVEDDEVLIRVKAASINPVDLKIREGNLKAIIPYKLPLILGNDCAGVIEKVGMKVTKFKKGDEVFTRVNKLRIGTLAEFAVSREAHVALKPKNASFEEAASLPLVGLTSWQAFERGHLKAGEKVFIPAGSGGVGTFAVQLAKYLGAFVITNTSTKNVDFVKSLGADEVIDYKKQDFSTVISNVDMVFDTMGGETQEKSFSVVKKGGHVVSIVGPPTAEFMKESGKGLFFQLIGSLMSLKAKRLGNYQFLFMRPDGEKLAEISSLVEQGKIRPVLDKVFDFSKADEALAYVDKGHARGKVVVSGPLLSTEHY